MRGSSSSPAFFERSEIDFSLVAKAKALELLALRRFGLAAELAPVSAIKPGDVLNELLLSACILFPPVIIGDTATVAQEVAVPILATADAAVPCLETAHAAFELVVGARKRLAVVALHQVRAEVGELLQELGEAGLLQFRERAVPQLLCQKLAPGIQAASHHRMAHDLCGLRPTAVQNVFGLQHPLLHAPDLRQRCRPADAFSDDGDHSGQLLGHERADGSPFFPSRCRLASTSSRSSPARTAGYSKGSVPSRFSAVSTPSA